MTKVQKEMLALADKIEHAIKTEGEITLFETNGTRVAYALRKLAEIVDGGEPQSSKQVDPAELWERYLDDIRADRGTPSPQGAMAFAVDALTRPDRKCK